MIKILVKRLISLLIVIIGVITVLFIVNELIPGNPLQALAGEQIRPEQVTVLTTYYGLDKPLYIRYLVYMGNLLRGQMGFSIMTQRPVLEDLRDYFPATLELTLVSMIAMIIFAIPLGVISAVYKGKILDQISRILTFIGVGLPVFWFGLMLQILLYGHLSWLPAGGRLASNLTPPSGPTGMYLIDALIEGNLTVFKSAAVHLILPVSTLVLGRIAVISRMTRSSLLEVLGENYVRTARSKGLSEVTVIVRHALRNAFIPILTMIGLQFGWLLQGTLVVETIFSYPGIGYYAIRAILQKDLPAILGVTVVITMMFVLVNFIVDLLYTVVDPRIRAI
jgi:peptide/nickel transport system permease protein